MSLIVSFNCGQEMHFKCFISLLCYSLVNPLGSIIIFVFKGNCFVNYFIFTSQGIRKEAQPWTWRNYVKTAKGILCFLTIIMIAMVIMFNVVCYNYHEDIYYEDDDQQRYFDECVFHFDWWWWFRWWPWLMILIGNNSHLF